MLITYSGWCQNLKDTEWFSRQDAYVLLEYSGARAPNQNLHRLHSYCSLIRFVQIVKLPLLIYWFVFVYTDGEKRAVFQDKFTLTLLEGLKDLKVAVLNTNTLSTNDFIGNATYIPFYVHSSFYALNLRFGIESFFIVYCALGFSCKRFFIRDTTIVHGTLQTKTGR